MALDRAGCRGNQSKSFECCSKPALQNQFHVVQGIEGDHTKISKNELPELKDSSGARIASRLGQHRRDLQIKAPNFFQVVSSQQGIVPLK